MRANVKGGLEDIDLQWVAEILFNRLVLRCIDERALGEQTKRLTAKRINAPSADAEKQK